VDVEERLARRNAPRKQFDRRRYQTLPIAALVSHELVLQEDMRSFQGVTCWLHRGLWDASCGASSNDEASARPL